MTAKRQKLDRSSFNNYTPFMKVLVIGGYAEPLNGQLTATYRHESDPAKAVGLLEHEHFDVVVTGLHIGPLDGFEILKLLSEQNPNAIALVTSQDKDPRSNMQCYALGAAGFLFEPFTLEELEFTIQRYYTEHQRRQELELYRSEHLPKELDSVFVGNSMIMARVKNTILQYAASQATLLIRGESGTGKGIAARLIHTYSPFKDGPFVALNCTAIPENLLESEFFGHEKGAFTGAAATKLGIFEQAAGGTLFLDEIGELPMSMQVKLLKAIEEKTIRRVGGNREIPVAVRIVAATNCDLEKAIQDRLFREDLYYRLNVLDLSIPPLRLRREDIPVIASHLLAQICQEIKKHVERFTPEALLALLAYAWPGNVREMKNIIERAVIHCHKPFIDVPDLGLDGGRTVQSREEDLPPDAPVACAVSAPADVIKAGGLKKVVDDFEKSLIVEALAQSDGNQSRAAESLGIKRTTLIQKIRKLRI